MVSFNGDREVGGGFDIMNIIIFPNKSFHRVKIGRVEDLKALEGNRLTLNEDIIVWQKGFSQVGNCTYFGEVICSLNHWSFVVGRPISPLSHSLIYGGSQYYHLKNNNVKIVPLDVCFS